MKIQVRQTASSDLTVTPIITNNGGIVKTGGGRLTLAGANTYTGTTTLNEGTLRITTSTGLGAGGFNGGTMTNIADNAALELQGDIAITEHFHMQGAGPTGQGVLRSLSGNTWMTTNFALDGDSTFAVDSGTLTIAASIYHDSGSHGLTKIGAGTLVLSGSNGYTGATVVSAGTLKLQGSPILTDHFTTSGSPDTADLNFNLADRQTGSAEPQNWSPYANVQVGNPTVVQQPPGTNGDYLLLAFGGEGKLAGLPLSSANVPGPLKISFDMFKGTSGDASEWTSFRLSPGGSGFPVAGSGEFGFLYRRNTGIQIFNNFFANGNVAIADFASTTDGDSFAIYFTDSAGTGSPFAGNGTKVIVTQGAVTLGTYDLNTGMAPSVIAFGSAGGMIGGVDNLQVTTDIISTNILADTNKLVINGGTVHLTGAETVKTLFFGAVQQPAGTYTANGNQLTGSGTLIVTDGPISGFASWMAPFITGGLTGDTTPGGDPDNDSMKNLLEYALNGNPSISDTSIQPDLVTTATDFEFTYSRLDLSLADTTQTFEYGSDLAGWTPVVIPVGPGTSTVGAATVTITDTGATDSVKISIPRSLNVGGKLFGRLQVVK